MNIKAIIIILLVIIAISFLLNQDSVRKPFLDFLNQNIPWSIPLFTFVKDNILAGSLMGVILYLVFVNIPILPSPPAEAYIIFAFTKGTNIFGILFVTIIIYLLFAIVYYFLARFYGGRMLERVFGKLIGYNKILDKLLGPLIFFSYLVPLPVPIPVTTILILFAGYYKTDFRKVIAAVTMGTLFRILIVLALYHFYTPLIEPYLSKLKIG